jgi:hypothetical protein
MEGFRLALPAERNCGIRDEVSSNSFHVAFTPLEVIRSPLVSATSGRGKPFSQKSDADARVDDHTTLSGR